MPAIDGTPLQHHEYVCVISKPRTRRRVLRGGGAHHEVVVSGGWPGSGTALSPSRIDTFNQI
jgi:hypothetical protein